jgi:hypothetical protein
MFRYQRLERVDGADLYRITYASEALAAEGEQRLAAEVPELGGAFAPDEEDDPLEIGEVCCLFASDLVRVRVALTRPLAPSDLDTLVETLMEDVLPRGVGDDVPCEIRVITGPSIVDLLLPEYEESEDDGGDEPAR